MSHSTGFLICLFTLASVHQVGLADENVMQVISATFKVSNADSTATGFVISRYADDQTQWILVTAAHVLQKASGDTCKLVLREQRLDGTFSRTEAPIAIRQNDKPLWRRHAKADVAVLKLSRNELPAGGSAGITPIRYEDIKTSNADLPSGIAMGANAWIAGFPAQLESSRAGFPVLRHGTVASFPLVAGDRSRTFMIDYSTFAGDSGGPVFLQDSSGASPIIIGLIHGQHRETTKSTTANEERTTHRPMGLAIVTHAKFICETVDLLP